MGHPPNKLGVSVVESFRVRFAANPDDIIGSDHRADADDPESQ